MVRSSMDEPVVVIGSGPCGAVAAAQLVARGIEVVMLDSGDRTPHGVIVRASGNTLLRWVSGSEYSTDRHTNTAEDIYWASSLSLGGLSNYWTAAVPRFAPDDFTEGGRLDERYVWPVSYEDLAPFYEMAERHLDVTAADPINSVPSNRVRHRYRLPADWQEVVDAARENGEGLGAIPMAKGAPWMIALRGTEFASYQCVVKPLLASPSFELRRRSHASRIVWSPSGGRVESIEFINRETRQRESVRARAVVIAAGAIDTTMLLLRSTSPDFPNGLGNSAGLIGRYLHDHPREWWTAEARRHVTAPSHPIYLARRPHGDSEPLMATSHTIGLASRRERLRTFYRGRTDRLGVQVFGTMVPTPDVGVSLGPGDGDDPVSERPVITLSYDSQAEANITSARARLCDVLGSAGLSVEVPGPFHDLLPGSSVHLAGTVRMHSDRQFGVLDGWNRMHDVPEVVVCDMSAFTTGPEKNPTLTAMALAIRAADRLASDLEK